MSSLPSTPPILTPLPHSTPAFHWGFLPGLAYSGFAAHVLKGKEPWTLENPTPDSAKTKPAADYEPITYPKPDGVFSFDLLTNLARSGTAHNDDQPAHLRIKPTKQSIVDTNESINVYDGPEQRFCPAGVYEYVEEESTGDKKLGKAPNRRKAKKRPKQG